MNLCNVYDVLQNNPSVEGTSENTDETRLGTNRWSWVTGVYGFITLSAFSYV